MGSSNRGDNPKSRPGRNKSRGKSEKTGRWKKLAGAMAVGALAAGSWWTISRGKAAPLLFPAYTSVRVVDGDTFVTAENQMIRIYGMDAPELTWCAGEAAKADLTNLIEGKKLYLKVMYRDSSNRLISQVFNQAGRVDEQMVARGGSYYTGNKPGGEVKLALQRAREKKIGIWSDECMQRVNLANPECNIKGNARMGSGERLYRFPGCGQYNNTIVSLGTGDAWFCSEKEAVEAGFSKGSDCFGKDY